MDTGWNFDGLRRVAYDTAKDYAVALVVAACCLFLLPNWYLSVLLNLSSLIILTNLIAATIIHWKPRGRVDIDGKAVLITGCDSGFGHMLAQRLDDLGFQVFASCLFPDGEGAEVLRKSCSSRLHIFRLDVTKDDDVQEAVKYVERKLHENKLWAVVCNAGIFGEGELHWTSMDKIQRTIDVNTFGVVRVTKAFLSLLCKSRGRVIVTASVAGRLSIPNMIAYSMSKHSIVGFCDGLRMEMYKWGVKVVSIEPCFYRTAITDKENLTRVIQSIWNQAPDDVKKTYPEDYLENYIHEAQTFLSIVCSRNVNQVVACYEEAIVSSDPKYSYKPGNFFNQLSRVIFSSLHKPIFDYLVLLIRVSLLSKRK